MKLSKEVVPDMTYEHYYKPFDHCKPGELHIQCCQSSLDIDVFCDSSTNLKVSINAGLKNNDVKSDCVNITITFPCNVILQSYFRDEQVYCDETNFAL